LSVPLLDLKREWEEVAQEVKEEWEKVFTSMRLFNGENLLAFEKEVAGYLGSQYAYGMGSGSDALLLALIACGIGPGDQVILHANAFAADVEAIKWAGARPVLVDAREEDFGPDPEQVEQAITPHTKALMVVHMYGHPVEMNPLLGICEKHGLLLIEDASHAHGAEYRGKKVGTLGKVGCFSCGVVKNLNALGDAGFAVTDDPEVAHRLNFLRVHGQVKKNDHHFYGFNSRLDELQAVILRARLKRLEGKNQRRREIAGIYSQALGGIEGLTLPPQDPLHKKSVYHRYVVRTPQRDRLMAYLKERGIGTGIYYPVPLHLQKAWVHEGYPRGSFPVSERLCRESLAIPLFPEMREEEIQKVIEAIKGFFGSGA
jgi:dTDP-4-amino-4,6-dideoxygalactose transaminase